MANIIKAAMGLWYFESCYIYRYIIRNITVYYLFILLVEVGHNPPVTVGHNELCYIIYSSGNLCLQGTEWQLELKIQFLIMNWIREASLLNLTMNWI